MKILLQQAKPGWLALACSLALAACQSATVEEAVVTEPAITAAEEVAVPVSESAPGQIQAPAVASEPQPVLEYQQVGAVRLSLSELPAVAMEPAPVLAPLTETLPELPQRPTAEELMQQHRIDALCEEIGNKLGSVSVQDCLSQQLVYGGGDSVNGRPLAIRDFLPADAGEDHDLPRVLIIGGIHGDEYSSISIMFRWMEIVARSEPEFHWRFMPATNPDGLLDGQAIRQNANGVDLNRNFPSTDWNDSALEYWINNTGSNPRRYPGDGPSSEPETRWLVSQIEEFAPSVIVSVHAPYHLLDFDGPANPPERIGELYLHQLGVFPGSLGNYAGIDLGIPVVTLELPSAGIMPVPEQIRLMWSDMLTWLHERESGQQMSSR